MNASCEAVLAAAACSLGLLLSKAALAYSPWPHPILYFDFGSSELTVKAHTAIDGFIHEEIYAKELTGSGWPVVLKCHADRAGSERFNLALAERRCRVVRDALVAAGFPETMIDLSPLGETDPLIPTADGVREIENRVVEIAPRNGV